MGNAGTDGTFPQILPLKGSPQKIGERPARRFVCLCPLRGCLRGFSKGGCLGPVTFFRNLDHRGPWPPTSREICERWASRITSVPFTRLRVRWQNMGMADSKKIASSLLFFLAIAFPIAVAQNQPAQPSSQAQNQLPSLRETGDWIAKTLEAYGGSEDDAITESIQNVHVGDDCKLTYDSITPHKDKHYKQKGWDTTHVEILLNNIVYVSHYTHGDAIWAGIALEYQLNGRAEQIEIDTHPQSLADGSRPERPENMVPRLVKALERATALCRAAYPTGPKRSDPF